jgi:hypothetical protein
MGLRCFVNAWPGGSRIRFVPSSRRYQAATPEHMAIDQEFKAEASISDPVAREQPVKPNSAMKKTKTGLCAGGLPVFRAWEPNGSDQPGCPPQGNLAAPGISQTVAPGFFCLRLRLIVDIPSAPR